MKLPTNPIHLVAYSLGFTGPIESDPLPEIEHEEIEPSGIFFESLTSENNDE